MADKNNIGQAIQTVARTKEIQLKLEKVTKELEVLQKQAIEALKSTATQTGDSAKDAGTGGTDSEQGTDSGGNAQTYPPAPPQTPDEQQQSQSSSSGDSYNNYTNTTGSGSTGQFGTGNTDLSGQGQTEDGTGGGGALGGSGGKEQAEKGDNNAEIQAIVDAMTDAGYSAEQIDKVVTELTQKKKGYHDVGDVMDGKAGPPPKFTSPDSLKYGKGGDQYNSQYKIEGVTGKDPNDTSIAVVVSFSPKSYIPSISDASAAGQDPWTTYDEGPIEQTYVSGQIYYAYGGLFTGGGVMAQTFSALVSAIEADTGLTCYEWQNGGSNITSLTPSLGADILVSTAGKMVGESGGTVLGYDSNLTANSFSNGYGPRTCGTVSGDTAICALDPPREVNWPQLGIYLLNKVGGQFVGSVFDADLPNQYKSGNPQGSARIKSHDGREFNILPGINGGTIIQDATLIETSLYYDADGQLSAFVAPEHLKFYEARSAPNIPIIDID